MKKTIKKLISKVIKTKNQNKLDLLERKIQILKDYAYFKKEISE